MDFTITAGPTVTDTVVTAAKVFSPPFQRTAPSIYRYISDQITFVKTTRGTISFGVLTDGVVDTIYTDELNNSGGTDVQVLPAVTVTNDRFTFGSGAPFSSMFVDVTTVATASAPGTAWEYWDGTAWSALSVTDASDSANGFATAGTGQFLLTWTPPADWTATVGGVYRIRIKVSNATNYTVGPILNSVSIAVPADNTDVRVEADTPTFLRVNPDEAVSYIRDAIDGNIWFTKQPGA